MPPLDAYRAQLQPTIASLKAWTGFVADVARVEESSAGDAWTLALSPQASDACPVSLTLHADPRFDLTIGDQSYRDRPVSSLDVVLPLLEAVVAGNVLTRHEVSSVTGLARATTTRIRLADGRTFEESHDLRPSPSMPESDPPTEFHDIHYVPYRSPPNPG